MDQAETLRKMMKERAGAAGASVTVFTGPGAQALVVALAATLACSGRRALAVRVGDGRADLMLPAGAGGAQAVRLSERAEGPLLESLEQGRGAELSAGPGASGAALPSVTLVADDGAALSYHWPVYRSVVILTPTVDCVDTVARLRRDRGVSSVGLVVNGCDSHQALRNLKQSAAREIDVELALFGGIQASENLTSEVPSRRFLLDLDAGSFSNPSLRSLAERVLEDGVKE